MSDEQNVAYVQAANHWSGREGYSPRYVILHGTAGFTTARQVADFFAQSSTQASVHYVVGQDGEIIQCVSEADAAWANGGVTGTPGVATPGSGNGIRDAWWGNYNPNLTTIAIEHVKPHTDNSDQLTDAQKRASFNLVAHICERHGIPKCKADANGGITGHYSMDAINRSHCPGPYPWDDLFTFLGGNIHMPIPTNWKDDGHTLTAPNNVPVCLGFRQHILDAASWDGGNMPQEAEYRADQVLLHNSSVGGGQRQIFRDTMLWWTPEKGVVQEPYVGLELDAAYRQIADLQAQLARAGVPLISQQSIDAASGKVQAIVAAAQNALHDLGK